MPRGFLVSSRDGRAVLEPLQLSGFVCLRCKTRSHPLEQAGTSPGTGAPVREYFLSCFLSPKFLQRSRSCSRDRSCPSQINVLSLSTTRGPQNPKEKEKSDWKMHPRARLGEPLLKLAKVLKGLVLSQRNFQHIPGCSRLDPWGDVPSFPSSSGTAQVLPARAGNSSREEPNEGKTKFFRNGMHQGS